MVFATGMAERVRELFAGAGPVRGASAFPMLSERELGFAGPARERARQHGDRPLPSGSQPRPYATRSRCCSRRSACRTAPLPSPPPATRDSAEGTHPGDRDLAGTARARGCGRRGRLRWPRARSSSRRDSGSPCVPTCLLTALPSSPTAATGTGSPSTPHHQTRLPYGRTTSWWASKARQSTTYSGGRTQRLGCALARPGDTTSFATATPARSRSAYGMVT